MTRRTNARLAGFVFLLYIATGLTSLFLFNQATSGAEGTAARLASIAQHASLVRLTAVLTLLQFLYAVVLGVTLYALTRDQDPDLAMLALVCRLTEGMLGAIAAGQRLELLSVATAATAAAGPDAAAAHALGALLMQGGGPIGATCFAVGSMLYSYLFLRARTIPVPLAWLGVLASALLVVALPLQLAGVLRAAGWGSAVTWLMWMPMLVFEVTLAPWLIIKGVATPSMRQSPPADAASHPLGASLI